MGLFMYQTMDNIDGKQARRTGTSSGLGELFDHGIDSLNCTLASLLETAAMGLGTSAAVMAAYDKADIMVLYILPHGMLEMTCIFVAAAAGLERGRLLRWILAWPGLSAAWSLEDGDDPVAALSVAEMAAAELAGS